MFKDLLFALTLAAKVIGTFIFCTFIGVKLDAYLKCQPIVLLISLLLAFIYVIKLLLGVGRHE